MSRPSTNGIVIVGAGPYGLSVAAHLRRYGLPFRIFGSPMQTWRSNMPAGMFLKSEGRASSLSEPSGSYTLRSHCEQYGLSYGEHGVPVPLETFSGRDVTVIGGGQSALETAAPAREQGANVHVFARQPRLVWNDVPQQGPRPLAQRLRRPTTGLGDG
jgi:cation diffusion facilitator CzcD-associated flavoprotein CzcO